MPESKQKNLNRVTQLEKKTERPLNILTPGPKTSVIPYIWKTSFYIWAKDNANQMTDDLLSSLASNLMPFGDEGRKEFHTICHKRDDYNPEDYNGLYDNVISFRQEKGIWATTYATMLLQGYSGPISSEGTTPANEVLALKQETDISVRGLFRKPKGGLAINANIYAKYVLTRMHLLNYKDAEIYAYDQSGYWRKISELQLAKILREILHEAMDNIWCKNFESEYMSALRLEMPRRDNLNQNRDYINLENGMLHLKTMTLRSHAPGYYSSIQIPIAYDLNAECPRFRKFLDEIMEGDSERIAVIQEMMGYFLTAETKMQKAFFFCGRGSNGKSVLATIIKSLCGDENVSNVSLATLSERFGMQELPDKTVNISTENEFSDKPLNTQNFKAITGGDSVNIEQKYKSSYSTTLYCKLLALVNNLPKSKDNSYGYYRRLVLILFNRTFRDEVQDKQLLDKLQLELAGILRFALDGLVRLEQQNYTLTKSQAIDKALEDYRSTQNPVIDYFEDMIEVAEGHSCERPQVHRVFSQWCLKNGYDDWARMGSQKFWELMANVMQAHDLDYRTKKVSGTIHVLKIRVRAELMEDGYGLSKSESIINF